MILKDEFGWFQTGSNGVSKQQSFGTFSGNIQSRFCFQGQNPPMSFLRKYRHAVCMWQHQRGLAHVPRSEYFCFIGMTSHHGYTRCI
jgi:hypothetical protein